MEVIRQNRERETITKYKQKEKEGSNPMLDFGYRGFPRSTCCRTLIGRNCKRLNVGEMKS